MLDDFLFRAALAGVGISLASAPLGCFVLWRRMAYFGDATAHAALLGVALALAFEIPILLGVLGIAMSIAFMISKLTGRTLGEDALLGVLSHSMLAVGLLSVSLLSGPRIDLMSYLVGDLLAVSRDDLLLIWGGGICVVGLIMWRWQALLCATLNPDLAQSAGINAKREQLFLTLALAIVVAVAIKVIGALLISALLIIPAAAARPLARSPEIMCALTALFGVIASLGGLGVSFQIDTPTGPSIITCATCIFILTQGVSRLR